MRSWILGVATMLLLMGCGDPVADVPPEREPFDGTVTFAIPGGDRALLSKKTMTFLSVDKPGKKELVDAFEAPEGSQYGRHNFPPGTSPTAVAGYYDGLLAIAGWKRNVDYRVVDGSIHVFGVRSLDAGADNDELAVTVSPKP